MAAPYLKLPDTNEYAGTPYHTDLDGYHGGAFFCARVRIEAFTGNGDAMTIAAMWKGPDTNNQSWVFLLGHTAFDGQFFLYYIEEGNTTSTNISDNAIVAHGLSNGDVFWIGASVRMPGNDSHTQFYYGGTLGVPVWETWGSELTAGNVGNIRAKNTKFTVGVNRWFSGPEDQMDGAVYEVMVFNTVYDEIDASSLMTWFNAGDFEVGDADTAFATDTTGKIYTLDGNATKMIFEDLTALEGGFTWWVPGWDDPEEEEQPAHGPGSGASSADLGYSKNHPRSSGAARRRIIDPLDSRRKFNQPF